MTGPVVIETTTGTRVVMVQALDVILESETVLAAAYEQRTVHIDEFGLLAVSAVRQHTVPMAMPIAGLEPLSLSEVQAALYPELESSDALAPRPRWNFSPRAIVHDAIALIALALWAYSASGIPGWRVWKRTPKSPVATPPA